LVAADNEHVDPLDDGDDGAEVVVDEDVHEHVHGDVHGDVHEDADVDDNWVDGNWVSEHIQSGYNMLVAHMTLQLAAYCMIDDSYV